MDAPATAKSRLDSDHPQAARMWNYWLGGKDHYGIDREAGDRVADRVPVADAALHSRYFRARLVRYLAGGAGIRQFLDIGTGLPVGDETHEVAQGIAPEARIVYVDNDPLVLAHARALLTSTLEGSCDHLEADARDTGPILAQAAHTLDFGQPVALLMLGVLNHIVDDIEARETVRDLVAPLAPGSHLVIAHFTADLHGDDLHQVLKIVTGMGGTPFTARTPSQIAEFFQDVDLLDPGIVTCSRWRPDPSPWPADAVLQYCGVGRKP
ncbi:SAM-dependent methyltransferase [Actinomadura sp. NPDC023710]|uniref:SAM-dependent methyltransferase n=1 Tax=Actinomadura sp. NPDC023710 TaxID=3158219 RepID=UPI0033F0A7F1